MRYHVERLRPVSLLPWRPCSELSAVMPSTVSAGTQPARYAATLTCTPISHTIGYIADQQGKTDSDRRKRVGKTVARNAQSGRHVVRRARSNRTSGERRTHRLTARLTPDQDAVIRHAAELTGTDITNFTVTTLLARAGDILADRRTFILDDAAWTEFNALLDAPVSHKPRLEKLFSEPTIFDTKHER